MLTVVPYLGEIVTGDKISAIVLTIRNRSTGLPFDLTGASGVAFVGRTKTGGQAVSISGALSGTPTDGTVTLSDPTNGVTLGTAKRDRVEGQVKFTQGGNPGWTSRTSYDVVVAADA